MISEIAEFKVRAEHYLDDLEDGTLVILRSHLLIEEILYRLVALKCNEPKLLEKANLRYFQLFNVARALYGNIDEELLVMVVETLNTLRNKMAHKLEPAELSRLLERLKIDDAGGPTSLSPKTVETLKATFLVAIGFLLGRLMKESEGRNKL